MSTEPRATDVLANERTLLAYLRTSLTFIAFGFVARFALFTREFSGVLHLAASTQHFSTSFGTAVALFGASIAVYGGYRYVVTDRALASGRAVSLSAISASIGAAVVALVGVAVGVGLIAFH